METFRRQVPLWYETDDFLVCQQAGTIENGRSVEKRQSDTDQHALRRSHTLVKDLKSCLMKVWTVKGILAAIPGDAKLWKTEDADSLFPGSLNGIEDVA